MMRRFAGWMLISAVVLACSRLGAGATLPGGAGGAGGAAGAPPSARPGAADGVAATFDGPSTTVGANVNITNKSGPQSETSTAINPTNPNDILAASNDLVGAGALGLYESTDGGRTFHNTGFNAAGFCYDPWVDFNQRGDAFLAYECGDQRIAYRKHGTFTWTPYIFGIAGSAPDRDMVVVDTYPKRMSRYAGSVYVGYDDNGQNNTAYVLYSRDGFGNWLRSQAINDNRAPTIGVHVSVGPKGVVYATWEDINNGIIFADRSTDGGATWGTDHVVHTYRLPTRVFFQHIPPQPKRGVVPFPFSVTARKGGAFGGRLYVSYLDLPAGADAGLGTGFTDVYVVHSDDGGQTWSPEKEVADGLPGTWRFHQSLSVSPKGLVGLSYYDTQQAPGGGMLVDRYISFSSDGGATWTPGQRVTTDSSTEWKGTDLNDYGDYQGMDAAKGNRFYLVWTDSRVSGAQNEDMFGASATP